MIVVFGVKNGWLVLVAERRGKPGSLNRRDQRSGTDALRRQMRTWPGVAQFELYWGDDIPTDALKSQVMNRESAAHDLLSRSIWR